MSQNINDPASIINTAESYCTNLASLAEFESNGHRYVFKVGMNEQLAKAWAENISKEAEVAKWTADANKRFSPNEILQRNRPGATKNIVTYSLWADKGELVAVSWYQIWNPSEEKAKSIIEFCKEDKFENPYIVTSAFRVALKYRRQGLTKLIIPLTESSYASYLSEKFKSSVNILFTLETDENNIAAVRTYLGNGYIVIGTFDQSNRESYRGRRLLMLKRHI